MSHHYIQASIANTYHISLMTIIRDFGLTKYDKISNNLREVERALNELKESRVILSHQAKKTFDAQTKNKIIDVSFQILPHPVFVNEMTRSNAKAKEIEVKTNNLLE